MIRTSVALILLVPAGAAPAVCPLRIPDFFGGGVTNIIIDEDCCNEIAAIPHRDECSPYMKDDLLGHMDAYCRSANQTNIHGQASTYCNYDLTDADPSKCVEATNSMCLQKGGKMIWNTFKLQCSDSSSIFTEDLYKPACMGFSCSHEDIQTYLWAGSPDFGICSFLEINGNTRPGQKAPVKRGDFHLYAILVVAALGVAFLAHSWAQSMQARVPRRVEFQQDDSVEMTQGTETTPVMGREIDRWF